tara:strand:+ start:711 stop:1418 length:708 start_codon:yes stop_codon:yes gene_type:complete
MKKILITGGNGNFAKRIIAENKKYKIIAPNKKKLNINNLNLLINYIKKNKPDYIIHSAALSSPMSQHNYKIIDSININIIGTSNVAIACELLNTKMIYISTNFVYPGIKGNYSENDGLLPINNYGWSKLGGECAVKLLKKHLILRICMTKDIFPHKKAYVNYISSYLTQTQAAILTLKLINKSGTINVGGKSLSAYKFAKLTKQTVLKGKLLKKNVKLVGINTSINISKLKKILK